MQSQQQMTPAGMVETQTDNVYVRFSGQFADVEMLKNMPINAGGRILRLGDIATVERRSVEPAEPKMFYNGQPAVGLAVSMENGGNILKLGENLKDTIDTVENPCRQGWKFIRFPTNRRW